MGVDLNSVTGANYPGGAWSAFKHHFLDNSQTAQDVAGAWEKALEYWSDPSRINRDAQSAFEALPSLQELGQGARNLGSAAVDEAAAIYADPGLAASGAWTWAKNEATGAWERAKDIYGKDGVPGVAGAAVGVIGDAVSPSKKLRVLKEGADAVHDLEKTKKLLHGGGKLVQDGNKVENGLNEASRLEKATQAAEGEGARGAVKPLEVGSYGELAPRSVGDGLSPDHIPSFAAIRTQIETKLGRPLTAVEARQLRNETTAIVIDTDIHQAASATYGGRNLPAQIAADAADLGKAAQRDQAALQQALQDRGYSRSRVNDAFEQLHQANKNKGLY